MKKFYIIISIVILLCLCGGGICLWKNFSSDIQISRIGIGGGGAFFNPMIDPTDKNVFYATSDMGALYYSHNQGKSWNRREARGVFTQTHITNNGVVFAGGNGIYASFNKGETLELIYPKNVQYSVSRCGWNENLMLADRYDNGYIKCIVSNNDNIFFVTIDWEGNLRLLKSDYYGNNLEILYNEQTNVVDPMSVEKINTNIVYEIERRYKRVKR